MPGSQRLQFSLYRFETTLHITKRPLLLGRKESWSLCALPLDLCLFKLSRTTAWQRYGRSSSRCIWQLRASVRFAEAGKTWLECRIRQKVQLQVFVANISQWSKLQTSSQQNSSKQYTFCRSITCQLLWKNDWMAWGYHTWTDPREWFKPICLIKPKLAL